jgi:hypothetical protein
MRKAWGISFEEQNFAETARASLESLSAIREGFKGKYFFDKVQEILSMLGAGEIIKKK